LTAGGGSFLFCASSLLCAFLPSAVPTNIGSAPLAAITSIPAINLPTAYIHASFPRRKRAFPGRASDMQKSAQATADRYCRASHKLATQLANTESRQVMVAASGSQ